MTLLSTDKQLLARTGTAARSYVKKVFGYGFNRYVFSILMSCKSTGKYELGTVISEGELNIQLNP